MLLFHNFMPAAREAIADHDLPKLRKTLEEAGDLNACLSPMDGLILMSAASNHPDMEVLSLLEEFRIPEASSKQHVVITNAIMCRADVQYINRLSQLGFSWGDPNEQLALRVAISIDRPECIEPALKAGVLAFVRNSEHDNPIWLIMNSLQSGLHEFPQINEWTAAAAQLLLYGGRLDESQRREMTPITYAKLKPQLRPFLDEVRRLHAADMAAMGHGEGSHCRKLRL